MKNSGGLIVASPLRARRTPQGGVILTRKFVEGMSSYSDLWDGPVTAWLEPAESSSSNLDEKEYDPAASPFRVKVGAFDDPKAAESLTGAKLVLGALDHRQTPMAGLCESIGVPLVFVAENTLPTRLQMVDANTRNPLLRLRRGYWERGQERRNQASVRLATGVQCNGTPTFDAYRTINANPFLFFDTRTTAEMLIAPEELETRLASLKEDRPLRLLFSGRLVAIKGADHLIRVAAELQRLGTPFEMTICGGGDQEPAMRAAIGASGLERQVKMAGVLDFETELTPLVKRWADLFVCCHRQGDPSCTYLETMACGAPIVGYDNEAFQGVVRESKAGWTTPMNQPGALAAKIHELNANRPAIAEGARQSLAFADGWTFERVFAARIEHLKHCAEVGRRDRPH